MNSNLGLIYLKNWHKVKKNKKTTKKYKVLCFRIIYRGLQSNKVIFILQPEQIKLLLRIRISYRCSSGKDKTLHSEVEEIIQR